MRKELAQTAGRGRGALTSPLFRKLERDKTIYRVEYVFISLCSVTHNQRLSKEKNSMDSTCPLTHCSLRSFNRPFTACLPSRLVTKAHVCGTGRRVLTPQSSSQSRSTVCDRWAHTPALVFGH